ncbi:hypothetical protein OG402_21805 [Streptomyces anulatus]|uniref:hypothetical protein n=1 Tax=Streptomyces anulatus TaxID=1892 RepID=UPI0022510312|nr:hypothetical protein [Streptomyces anulatus]MCX4520231.1 hypothetical protein [Streptomyces anulatus]MCX4603102.1 hypothetical protein [Streptomyces anulatus]WSI79457.1 hypothetical protein OG557_22100 [Streptomyces anulatus]
MLSHVIPPPRGYTKAPNCLVRHPRLGSDAKVLVLYVQGLPEEDRDKALGEHARALRMTGRAYQKAKADLVTHGYVHEKRESLDGGRWRTVQVFSNEPLTADQAARLRAGVPADGCGNVGASAAPDAWPAPSAHSPTVGEPTGRTAGGQLPADEELGEDSSRPPTEAVVETKCDPQEQEQAEVLLAERVLLSLRHRTRELSLGVREARKLAALAAEWLRRGVSAGDLRLALSGALPEDGVRSAFGFLAHRLVEKLPPHPEATAESSAPPPPPYPPSSLPLSLPLLACDGPGAEHMFRPHESWVTTCGPCHREQQRAYWAALMARAEADPAPPRPSWRELAAEAAANGDVACGEEASGYGTRATAT